MKSALIATSFFFFCFFGKDFLAHFLSHHSVSHQNSPRHELHISFSCCCCCFCFVSLSLYFRLNWQQLLSLLLLTLTFFFSLLLPPTLSGFSASLLLFSVCPGKVFIYSHSVALFYPCCASLCQVEKSHFRHLQRHLHGRPIPTYHVPLPHPLPHPLLPLSYCVLLKVFFAFFFLVS